ncbi:MAG: hypothetical protein ACRD3T_19640 [Terriglobia bacterium]
MQNFALDRTGLIFFCLVLVLFCWAVFDTQRFLRLLSLNRKAAFTHFELVVIRVPGAVVIIGASWLILATLLRNW